MGRGETESTCVVSDSCSWTEELTLALSLLFLFTITKCWTLPCMKSPHEGKCKQARRSGENSVLVSTQTVDAPRNQNVVRHSHSLIGMFGYREFSGSSLGAHRRKKCPRHWPGTAEAAMCWCVRRGQLSPRLVLCWDLSLTFPCLHFGDREVFRLFRHPCGWRSSEAGTLGILRINTEPPYPWICPSSCHLGGFKVGRQLFLVPPNAPITTLCLINCPQWPSTPWVM